MTEVGRIIGAGASRRAIEQHYDLSDQFFGTWLGDDLTYSCALWDLEDDQDSLSQAQARKLDYFADRLDVRGGRLLDVGCGWGALLERFARVHGLGAGVGLTPSRAQTAYATSRAVPRVSYLRQSWAEHEPEAPYDAITCIEATEHFASGALSSDEKVEIYRAFFDRAWSWLRPGGRMGLQLICLDNAGPATSRPGASRFTDLILDEIFPESMSASLSELVLGWETHFELEELVDHTRHYTRTFRAWTLAFRDHEELAASLVGQDRSRTFARYFAGSEALFRLREQALYRVILTRRPEPKVWAVAVRPSAIPEPVARGASAPAIQAHYDVSNDFYRQWLGPSMMYSSGLWTGVDDTADLERALEQKIDYFAGLALPESSALRVLDVGCGWGGTLRRLGEVPGVESSVGLTLSPAQRDYLAAHPVPGADIRLEDWNDHDPSAPYDAIFSFGAFEHFARDGTTGPDRVATYRRFFSDCSAWLVPGGRLALETIAHDNAPDTDRPLGRGPLGDFVLKLFPESLCPHLGELVLGFEPFFELEVLRSDAADFARTFRAWLLALRAHETEAVAVVGEEVTRQFVRYLAASEIQFRTRTITNYRIVLRRRPAVRA